MEEKSTLRIGKKAFLTSVGILLILVIIAGILTVVVPSGKFQRTTTDGREVIVKDSYRRIEKPYYPVYRWITAPIEVLWGPDSVTVIGIILVLLLIGASFVILEETGIIEFLMNNIVEKYGDNKYKLLNILILFFMFFGATLGIFDELIALVPIVVTLSHYMGWDSLVGLGASALAAGFGFTAAVFNPFTIAIAQEIAELPLFSGIGFRAVIFVIVYLILSRFILNYAKKIEKNPELSLVYEEDRFIKERIEKGREHSKGEVNLKYTEDDKVKSNKAMKVLSVFLILICLLVVAGFFLPELSSYSLLIVAFLFFVGAFVSGTVRVKGTNMEGKLLKFAVKGFKSIAPAILLIMLAMSIKYIVTEGGIMDTILNYSCIKIQGLNSYLAVFFIYMLVFFLDFFISSGSAKAFLVMPIIVPLADLTGITRQLVVQAYCFGDGFSNMLFPTNASLMIALGFTVVGYPKWFKWTWKLQMLMLILTVVALFIGLKINYGPF